MTLRPEDDGDIGKVAGHSLFVARNLESGAFIGFYAFTPDATYIRGAGNWITAKGEALAKLNGAQLVEMKKSFIRVFDELDSKGETPTDERLAKGSTNGRPGSWDTQNK